MDFGEESVHEWYKCFKDSEVVEDDNHLKLTIMSNKMFLKNRRAIFGWFRHWRYGNKGCSENVTKTHVA